MRALLPGLLLFAACVDFDAIEREACAQRGLCDVSCQPCVAHADCGGPNSMCLPSSSGGFCAPSCAENAVICRPGHECAWSQAGERHGPVCRPTQGRLCDGGSP